MEKWRYCDVERNERRRLNILQRKCKIYRRVKNFFFCFLTRTILGSATGVSGAGATRQTTAHWHRGMITNQATLHLLFLFYPLRSLEGYIFLSSVSFHFPQKEGHTPHNRERKKRKKISAKEEKTFFLYAPGTNEK